MIHLMTRWVKNSQKIPQLEGVKLHVVVKKKICRTVDGIIEETECKCSECAINFCVLAEWVMFATV